MNEQDTKIENLEYIMREHTHDGIDGTTKLKLPLPNVKTITTATEVTPTNLNDCVDITALASAVTINNVTGTPYNFQKMIIRFKDNGTARGITWGSGYVAGGSPLPSTTVLSKIMYVGLIYNTANALNKWQCVSVAQEA